MLPYSGSQVNCQPLAGFAPATQAASDQPESWAHTTSHRSGGAGRAAKRSAGRVVGYQAPRVWAHQAWAAVASVAGEDVAAGTAEACAGGGRSRARRARKKEVIGQGL